MTQANIMIQNILGLHARPAARFVQLASTYPCDIELVKETFAVNGKSILGVMSLAAEKGSVITIRADGDKEKEAVAKLIDLMSQIFEEEE